MRQQIQRLVTDPQNDFCDLPAAYRPVDPLTGSPVAPALPVAGAHADMRRVAALIRDGGFEAQQAAFFAQMQALGVRSMTSAEALERLSANVGRTSAALA